MFPATGWPSLPADPWAKCATRVSEGRSSISIGIQGDYSWLVCGLNHGKTESKQTSYCVNRLQTSKSGEAAVGLCLPGDQHYDFMWTLSK